MSKYSISVAAALVVILVIYLVFSEEISDKDRALSSGSSLTAVDGKWHVSGLMDDEAVFVLQTDIKSSTTRGRQGSYNSNTRGVGGSGELVDDVSAETLLTWEWNVQDDMLVVNDETFVLSENRVMDVPSQD